MQSELDALAEAIVNNMQHIEELVTIYSYKLDVPTVDVPQDPANIRHPFTAGHLQLLATANPMLHTVEVRTNLNELHPLMSIFCSADAHHITTLRIHAFYGQVVAKRSADHVNVQFSNNTEMYFPASSRTKLRDQCRDVCQQLHLPVPQCVEVSTQ